MGPGLERVLPLGSQQYFPGKMGTPAPAATKSALEASMVGKGSAGEGSHSGQGTALFGGGVSRRACLWELSKCIRERKVNQ